MNEIINKLERESCEEGETPIVSASQAVIRKMLEDGDHFVVGSVNGYMGLYAEEVARIRERIRRGEVDPSGKDVKIESGGKTDKGKIMLGLLEDFPLALSAVADVATYGVTSKYCRGSWRDIPEAKIRCQDARIGHYLKHTVEERCPVTNLLHLAQACWNGLVELEAAVAANPELTAQYLERVATRGAHQ